jgi:hypothetical protein
MANFIELLLGQGDFGHHGRVLLTHFGDAFVAAVVKRATDA